MHKTGGLQPHVSRNVWVCVVLGQIGWKQVYLVKLDKGYFNQAKGSDFVSFLKLTPNREHCTSKPFERMLEQPQNNLETNIGIVSDLVRFVRFGEDEVQTFGELSGLDIDRVIMIEWVDLSST